jgi:hypothetical protein
MAHALVADGWKTGDAVAVFGNRSEFRSPLEWYLPGNPQLGTTSPAQIDEPVFVIDSRGIHGAGTDLRRVDDLVVERLRRENPSLYRRLLRRANIFVSVRLREHVRI